MTILVAWIGVDSRAPTSAYIATDSRISWPASSAHPWDVGRKTFCSKRFPDLFGYVGDVLLPSLILGQFVAMVDGGWICDDSMTLSARQAEVRDFVRTAVEAYPNEIRAASPFTIVHVGRSGLGQATIFEIHLIRWNGSRFAYSRQTSPTRSSILKLGTTGVRALHNALGSGQAVFETELRTWQQSAAGGTSRAVFSAFCDALQARRDPAIGGPPQLVGLRKIGTGKDIATFYAGKLHLMGRSLTKRPAHPADLECFNALFERVDTRGRVLPKAQTHRPPASASSS